MNYASGYYDIRTFLVYIDSYDHGVPKGQFYNPYKKETGLFSSLSQMILKLEQCLDEENIPQSFHKIRTFQTESCVTPENCISDDVHNDSKATFVIQVQFRRNTSWQGSFVWLDRRRTEKFRSVLELIYLMDSALSETDTAYSSVSER